MEESKNIILVSGTRKRAKARLRLKEHGRGRFYVNGQRPSDYFRRDDLVITAMEPIKVTSKLSDFDIVVKVEGGGKSGQAGAVRLALAKALVVHDPSLLDVLKKYGMLSRDPREKERMKYGKSKRRRSPQFSKR